MKKFFMTLMVLIGFGISVNAQQKGTYYRSSYSSTFMCVLKSGCGSEAYEACKSGAYANGYEDGYAGKEHQYCNFAIRMYKYNNAVMVASLEPADVPAEALSYAAGYKDGEKDRKKEGR